MFQDLCRSVGEIPLYTQTKDKKIVPCSDLVGKAGSSLFPNTPCFAGRFVEANCKIHQALASRGASTRCLGRSPSLKRQSISTGKAASAGSHNFHPQNLVPISHHTHGVLSAGQPAAVMGLSRTRGDHPSALAALCSGRSENQVKTGTRHGRPAGEAINASSYPTPTPLPPPLVLLRHQCDPYAPP